MAFRKQDVGVGGVSLYFELIGPRGYCGRHILRHCGRLLSGVGKVKAFAVCDSVFFEACGLLHRKFMILPKQQVSN